MEGFEFAGQTPAADVADDEAIVGAPPAFDTGGKSADRGECFGVVVLGGGKQGVNVVNEPVSSVGERLAGWWPAVKQRFDKPVARCVRDLSRLLWLSR